MLNPYNPCVANQMIEGYISTICWYADNIKISHHDEKVVSAIIKKWKASLVQ